jgi:hypothetical protein
MDFPGRQFVCEAQNDFFGFFCNFFSSMQRKASRKKVLLCNFHQAIAFFTYNVYQACIFGLMQVRVEQNWARNICILSNPFYGVFGGNKQEVRRFLMGIFSYSLILTLVKVWFCLWTCVLNQNLKRVLGVAR